jgi:phosphoribosyl-ATP pyrophosphohydrolase/phosphoribosyl-AMP cyclohydrolase
MTESIIHSVRFDERGLIPAIIQDATTNEVVALHYMDNDSLLTTLKTGEAFFGGKNEPRELLVSCKLVDVRLNPDGGSLTVLVERQPIATTDKKQPLDSVREKSTAVPPPNQSHVSLVDVGSMVFGISVNRLYSLIADRKEKRPENSYTTYLFNSGLDKILKKVAEESGEVLIAAKNSSHRELVSELADLFYHLLVLMVERNIKLSDVQDELTQRAAQARPSEQ